MLSVGLGVFLGSEASKMCLGILGGIVLMLTGLSLVKNILYNCVSLSMENPVEQKTDYGLNSPMLRGVVACVANPYFIVWWATVGSSFIIRGSSVLGWVAPFIFLLTHWAFDLPWFAFISYTVGKGMSFLDERGFKIILMLCGVSLMLLGLIYIKDGLDIILVNSARIDI